MGRIANMLANMSPIEWDICEALYRGGTGAEFSDIYLQRLAAKNMIVRDPVNEKWELTHGGERIVEALVKWAP